MVPATEVGRSCGGLIELARSASALNADTVTGTVCAFSLTRRAVTTISPMPESVGVSVAGGTDGMLPPTEPVGAPCAAAATDEPRNAADATQFNQIDRASCRERRCQYVEISVVAASINKKKQTENIEQHNLNKYQKTTQQNS